MVFELLTFLIGSSLITVRTGCEVIEGPDLFEDENWEDDDDEEYVLIVLIDFVVLVAICVCLFCGLFAWLFETMLRTRSSSFSRSSNFLFIKTNVINI